MTHERKQIRDAVATMLLNKTAAGARVFVSRRAPIRPQDLPGITVYADSEEVDEGSTNSAPMEIKRRLEVSVDCWVNQGGSDATIEDTLDAMSLEVEVAMDSGVELQELCDTYWLASTELQSVLVGDKPIACAHLVYVVQYYTMQRTDVRDGALDDLKIVDTRFSLSSEQDDPRDQAEDTIEDLDQ